MKERNKQMDVLLCLGILLVVLGHVGPDSWKTKLFGWFVIYSFHMPLFFFISGYFYKPEREEEYGRSIFRMIRKFVVPYYVWNLLYAVIVFALHGVGLVRFHLDKSVLNFLITPWTTGNQYQLNSPAWFLLTLFLVEAVYLSLHKLCGFFSFKNEYILALSFFAMSIAGGGMMVYGVAQGGMLVLAKMLYGIGFYHLGHLYKTRLEKRDKLNNIAYFGILFVVQYFLMVITDGFPYISMWNGSITTMGKNIFLPVAVALTGIGFTLRISKILTPSLGDSKIVRTLSMSTKTIMIHHYAVIVFFNVLLSLIHKHIFRLKYFDEKWVSVLYKYPGPHDHPELFSFVYIILCLAVPVGGSMLFYKAKNVVTGKRKNSLRVLAAETGSKNASWDISAEEGTDNVSAWYEGSEEGGYKIHVAGEGRMTVSFRNMNLPWESIRNNIIAVEIKEGVTNVGAYAFNFCRNLKSVSLPESLTEIGTYAFNFTKVKKLTIPSQVNTIGRMVSNSTTYYEVLGNPENVNNHAFTNSLVSVTDQVAAEALNAKTNVSAVIVLNGGVYGETDKDLDNLSYGLIQPKREGFVFNGWYQSADFSGKLCQEDSKGRTTTNINHIYYAKWTEAV